MEQVSAISAANYLISKAKSAGVPMTPLKVQKILYYAQGWSLVLRGKPIFNEDILAWKLGPVVRSVYDELKRFGATDITKSEYSPVENIPENDKIFLDSIWETYGELKPGELVAMTHLSKPWIDAYNNPDREVIYTEELRDYFGRFAKETGS